MKDEYQGVHQPERRIISSAEAKEKSLYNQLLYEVEKGTIVRVRQGVYALNEGLAKPMVDVERLVPGGVLCAYSA